MKLNSFALRHWKSLLLVAVLTLLLLWVFPSRKPLPLPEGPIESPPSPSAEPSTPLPPTPEQKVQSTRETVHERVQERGRIPSISQSIPDLKTYREEVQADPHSTPASILRLAEVLAEHRVDVKAHPEKAGALMKELQDCVLKATDLPSAQAMCLNNAEQLVKENATQAELQEELHKIREMASAEARKIVRRISQI